MTWDFRQVLFLPPIPQPDPRAIIIVDCVIILTEVYTMSDIIQHGCWRRGQARGVTVVSKCAFTKLTQNLTSIQNVIFT